MIHTILFIDGSYFCFYRYYALLTWWNNAKKDQPLDNPANNPEFVEKYKKTFISKLQEIKKKLNIPDAKIIIGKDCPRENIWRMNIDKNYKCNRTYDDTFMGGPFFKMAYDDDLFIKGGAKMILSNPLLEADDCIALSSIHICNNKPEINIYIITSDTDYLQLLKYDNIHIYNLKYKEVKDTKTYHGDPDKYLFCKILSGDKTDGIPPVFDKCGPKTAEKMYNNKDLFHKKLADPDIKQRYEINKTLIDFDNIPQDIVNDFHINFI